MNVNNKFTIVIQIQSENSTPFKSCLWSLYDLNDTPSRMIIICDDYSKKYDEIFELGDIIDFDIIKTYNKLSFKLTNQLIKNLCDTPYILVVEDDVVNRDANLLTTLYSKHQEGYNLIRASEYNTAISYDVSSFSKNCVSKEFQFDPFLLRHSRLEKSRLNKNLKTLF